MTYPNAVKYAVAMLGAPYVFGAKWPLMVLPGTSNVPIDCSGFSTWVLAWAGVTLPEGSFNQAKVCTVKLPASLQDDPPALALGFYAEDGSTVDHVIVSCGGGVVVEAHGTKVLTPGVPQDCVVLRTVAAWLEQPGFLGFYEPPGLNLGGAS